jgi:hypothetical protein
MLMPHSLCFCGFVINFSIEQTKQRILFLIYMNRGLQYNMDIKPYWVAIDSHITTTLSCGNRYNYRGNKHTFSCNKNNATVAIENPLIATIKYHGNR